MELAELLVEMAGAVEEISGSIIHAAEKKTGTKNPSGEEQIAMDVLSNEIIARYLRTNPFVASFTSEEMEKLQKVNPQGQFSAYFDPLDGSSLFDVNFSVGTIMGIYALPDVIGHTPREQVAAFYAVYGPRTSLVLSVGNGVHEFWLTEDGWQLSRENIRLHGENKYFAPGNLRAAKERPDYLELVNWYIKEQYTLRYSGGMVPDLNHIFQKGSGIFIYPGMPSAPKGKLRLLYECGPMAFLMEQAGGDSSCGDKSILDIEITEHHQRTPIYIGTKEEVMRVTEALK